MVAVSHFARRGFLISVILHLAMSPCGLCSSGNKPQPANYTRTGFSTEQGLYSNLVDVIVQSSDGLLWLRVNGDVIALIDDIASERTATWGL